MLGGSACTLLLLGLQPTALLSILGLCFASYIPLGTTGILPVCGLCPPQPLSGAPRCLASLDLHLRLAPYCSSASNLLPFSPYWGFVLPLTYPSAALVSNQSVGLAHFSPHLGLPHASPLWASTLMVPLFTPLFRCSLALLPTLHSPDWLASGLV